MCDRDAQLCRVICPCSFLAKQRACLHSDGARSLYQNWLGKRSHLCSARCGCSASATGSTTQRPTVLTDRSKMHGKQPRRTQPIPESWSASNAIHRSSLQYWCCQCSRRTRARGQPHLSHGLDGLPQCDTVRSGVGDFYQYIPRHSKSWACEHRESQDRGTFAHFGIPSGSLVANPCRLLSTSPTRPYRLVLPMHASATSTRRLELA